MLIANLNYYNKQAKTLSFPGLKKEKDKSWHDCRTFKGFRCSVG